MFSVRRSNKKWRYVVRMDVCWSIVLKLEHPCTGGSRYTPSAEVQSTTASHNNDISIIWRISFESFTKGGGERHRSHRSVIYEEDIGSAWEWCQIKLHTSCDVPAALNQRRTTTFDQHADNSYLPNFVSWLSFPHWSRVLIKNLFQKCSRDDHKMTLGGLHGRVMVQCSGVGARMVPRGRVIHHEQRCRAQQQVIPTISQ